MKLRQVPDFGTWRAACSRCHGCVDIELEVAINILLQRGSLATLDAQPIKDQADGYYVRVGNNASLRFRWNDPYIENAEFVCGDLK
ncbi:hypothetical protein SAMN03080610_03576 [Afifella marina DSM 2698]|uniref:Uncharacterized protein n=1 Tax=Afifella marina DSM 2698 TaxID=1120955 RepID=A0A1G5PA20_AFIMA|nr:hypothetical protein SAMN03080610_03576 [Afifella marina DSM 2698]